jgi:polyisoprenoid-binding protein YceI
MDTCFVNCSRILTGVLSVLIVVAAGSVCAAEPCKPFEDGRVDARLLQVMRDAAKQGRLYRVSPGESKVGFCVRHFPFGEFRGEFTNIVAGLAIPPARDQHGQALLLIRTASMQSSNPKLIPLVQGHQFMDTEHYPDILFVGRAFQWLKPQQGHIYGDLTLRGKTRPVVFNIGIDVLKDGEDGRPERIYLKGTSEVNRVNFDMRSYRFVVSERVRLCLSVELVQWVP